MYCFLERVYPGLELLHIKACYNKFYICLFKVYNETIRDLMMPSGCLPIREDPNNGVVVHGLSLHKVSGMLKI